MASCQTWSSSSHFRHPWFDNAVPKRKQPETVSQDEDSHPPPKRLRSSVLERGFAHLSLNSSESSSRSSKSPSPPPTFAQNVAYSDVEVEEPMDMDVAYQTPLTPITSAVPPAGAIEEPSIPEINMKASSWYEPEPDRIVITDLDSYTHEDDDEGQQDSDSKEESISVNSALLDHIKHQTLDKTRSKITQPPASASQALVLFKPLPLPISSETPPSEQPVETTPATIDDNAMDIE